VRGVEPRLGGTGGVLNVSLLFIADLDGHQVVLMRKFRAVKRRRRGALIIDPLPPLLARRKNAGVGVEAPNHRVHVAGGQLVVIEREAGIRIQAPDLQPVVNQQLMPLIKRGNLGVNGQPEGDNNANGKNGETKIFCELFNAIKRRRSLPLYSGRRLFLGPVMPRQ